MAKQKGILVCALFAALLAACGSADGESAGEPESKPLAPTVPQTPTSADAGRDAVPVATFSFGIRPGAGLVAPDRPQTAQPHLVVQAAGSYEAVPDRDAATIPDHVPDTVTVTVDYASESFNAGAGAFTIDVGLRNNFGDTLTDVIAAIESIDPAAGRRPVGDDRPIDGLAGVAGAWRYGDLASGVETPLRTWTVEVPDRTYFVITGSIYAYNDSNNPPLADAGGPYVIDPGESVTLDASASTDSDAGDFVTQYGWDLNGDGFFNDATGVTAQFTYRQLGELGVGTYGPHTVSVRVRDNNGATAIGTAELTVRNVPLRAVSASETLAVMNGGDPGHVTVTFNRPISADFSQRADATLWDRCFDVPWTPSRYEIAGNTVRIYIDRSIGYNYDWELFLDAGAIADLGGNPNEPYTYSFTPPVMEDLLVLGHQTSLLEYQYQVAIADNDGTNLQVLTNMPIRTANLARYTRDGAGIVFQAYDPNLSSSHIYYLQLWDMQLVEWDSPVIDQYALVTRAPDLSPDFTQVVFHGETVNYPTEPNPRLFIWDRVEDTVIDPVSGGTDAYFLFPVWSSDGTRIAYSTNRDTPSVNKVYLYHLDSGINENLNQIGTIRGTVNWFNLDELIFIVSERVRILNTVTRTMEDTALIIEVPWAPRYFNAVGRSDEIIYVNRSDSFSNDNNLTRSRYPHGAAGAGTPTINLRSFRPSNGEPSMLRAPVCP